MQSTEPALGSGGSQQRGRPSAVPVGSLYGENTHPEAGETSLIRVEGFRLVVGGRTLLSLDQWELGHSDRTLVVGPSGSGKTSFLHVLAGLRLPEAGKVIVAGQNLASLSEAERDAFRGRRIGYVFQTLHLVRALSVLDNLRLAAFLAGNQVAETELKALLASVGLERRAHARTFDLSHGEAQRIAIARALVNDPILVLADEPTSALDDRNARLVLDLLVEATAGRGAALVIATHDIRLLPLFERRLALGGE